MHFKAAKIFVYFVLGLGLISMTESCSIEHRRYTSGYYMHRNHDPKKSERKTIPTEETAILSASAETNDGSSILPEEKLNLFAEKQFGVQEMADSCDKIMLLDGSVINASITQERREEIFYRACPSLSTGELWIPRSKVAEIKYLDGRPKPEFPKQAPEKTPEVKSADTPSSQPQTLDSETTKKHQANVLGTLSLCFGVLSFLIGFVTLTDALAGALTFAGAYGAIFAVILLFGLAAVGCGIAALIKARRNKKSKVGKGLGVAGLITGGVMAILSLIALWLTLIFESY